MITATAVGMTWQDEFLDYQEALDDARKDQTARERYGEMYRNAMRNSDRAQREMMQRASNPLVQAALVGAIQELTQRRVDDLAVEFVKNNVGNNAFNFDFSITDFGRDFDVISRVEVELPALRIALPVRGHA